MSIGRSNVYDQRYRAVVHELHAHVRAEHAALRTEALAHPFVELLSPLRAGCGDEAWAVSAPRIAVDSEVRDAQDRPGGVRYRQVHPPVAILEDPQRAQLVRHAVGGRLVVVLVDAEENQQAALDAGHQSAVDRHPGRRHPLDDCPQCPMRMVWLVVNASPVASTLRTRSEAVVTCRLATYVRPFRVSLTRATQRRPELSLYVRV